MSQGGGNAYKITVGSGDWGAFFSYGIRAAIINDLKGIGGQSFSGRQVEIWNPANPRGDVMPNMVFEFLGDGILVTDLGGHQGLLMDQFQSLFAVWRERYFGHDLRLNAI